jgi:hypothetical protein
MSHHTAPLRLSALLLVSTVMAPPAAQSAPASRQHTVVEPRITFLDPPTPKARQIIAWAVDRFGATGLQLPDLDISFPTSCDGKAALYHGGRSSIDLCYVVDKRTVLHEFAHAWDDTSGAVDRAAFLKLRGLSIWWGGIGMPSDEQGAEHLAEIIAWGLMDGDTRSAPQLPANSVSELTHAFVMLTHGSPG